METSVDPLEESRKRPYADLAFLSGGGEMGELIRSKDWSKTPLGPVDRWPQSLQTAVRIMLTSRQPIWIGWGEQLIKLYNDPYKAIVRGKHPAAVGQPASVVWREIWPDIEPLLNTAMGGIEGTYVESQLLIMERTGYPEETYYTYSYSPIPDDQGGVGGIFCANTDDTDRVIGERQLALLKDLAARTVHARTFTDVCRLSAVSLQNDRHDFPFTLMYLAEQASNRFVLAATSGIEPSQRAAAGHAFESASVWPLAEVIRTQKPAVITNLSRLFDHLPTGAWKQPPYQAVVMPIVPSEKSGKVGILIAGLNPFRLFDDRFQRFVDLVVGQIAASIANAQRYEEERKRAEALEELDRAKTAFFSNVSHEFRTPLTLMLGPLEDLKSQFGRTTSSLDTSQYQQVDLIHRNGLRLLKLVNTVLDFSRIEAGRAQALYEETDLATFTTELASVFRSTIEKAGLSLIVECPPLPEPVFVDREMWEKIVLNLLSNAFKFTFEGEIEVALRPSGTQVELSIRDTGTGIPDDQLGKIFERFHRVAGTQGRTFEGTGIGLALVQELARLHGGTVSVESVYGKGSTFRVFIPLGKSHLPSTPVGAARAQTSTAVSAMPFVEEAARWLPSEDRTEISDADTSSSSYTALSPQLSVLGTAGTRPRVLLADDNADMRDYVRRLLAGQGYEVESVADGQAALDRAQANPPDIVLTDVMMPRLDGFGLLKALRANERMRGLPIIMLSARAGEESRVEGLEHGADDYLIKPFSARELLARVGMHVKMARMRHEAQAALLDSETRFRNLADTAPAMLWVTEPNGSCSFLSRGWYEFTGQTKQEGLGGEGFGWLEAIHPEDREPAGQIFMEANEKRCPFNLDYRLRRYDGEYRWAVDTGRPRFGPNAEFLGYIGSVLDITERKQAEESLQVSQEETKRARDYAEATLRSSPVPLLVLEKDLRVNTANEAFYRTFQVDPAETTGRLVYALGNGQWNIPELKELLETVLPQHTVFTGFEVTHDFESIGRRTMLLNVRRMENELDGPERIVLVIEDITNRKRAEEALCKSRERFDLVSDAAEVGFWFCDLPFDELIWDNRVKEHFWLPPDSHVTIDLFYERLHPEDRERTRRSIQASIADNTRYDIEYRTVSPEGQAKWIRAIGRTFYDENKKPIRFDGVTLDITERKRVEEALWASEEELRTFAAQLEQRVAERTQELAQSEDRLRTLATELNLAEQRERKRLATDLHDYLAQLLVLGRITLGQAKRTGLPARGEEFVKETEEILNKSLTYCRTLMAELSPPVLRDQGLAAGLKWLSEYMKKHQIAVTVTVPERDDLKLREDQAVLLFQSVRELVMNACKHAGTMEASVVLEQLDGMVRITVSDRGAGFDLATVADKAASPLSSKYGLYSIRERMKALGGNFEILSTVGHGTTATLTLPVAGKPLEGDGERYAAYSVQEKGIDDQALVPSHPTVITHHATSQKNTIRILLVDDHPMMRQGLRSIVTAYDHLEVVGEAGDGAEAVELAQRLDPDVVVMDVNMPKMDGIEATRRIKANQPATIVIGLSVNQSTDTEQKMTAAGAFTYLTKESAVDALCHAIEQAVSCKQPMSRSVH